MTILLNLSNLSKGGGIQVGISFLESLRIIGDQDRYIVVCSKYIYNLINKDKFSDNFVFIEINITGFNIKSQISGIRKLKSLEKKYDPNGVLTLFGPTLYRPKCKHIVGFAQGHLIDVDSPYWKIARNRIKFGFFVKKFIFKWIFNFTADYLHIESNLAKTQLINFLKISPDKIVVANNYPHSDFDKISTKNKIYLNSNKTFKIAVICAYYDHKNLEILNEVIKEIEKYKDKININFILTIEKEIFEKKFIKSKYIKNIGKVHGSDLLNLYDKIDAVLLPSLLEIFPGNYLEAMKTRNPILTSDLKFATNICGDAALYFDPLNKDSILQSIIKLINNQELYNSLQNLGSEKLLEYNDSIKRVKIILDKLNHG